MRHLNTKPSKFFLSTNEPGYLKAKIEYLARQWSSSKKQNSNDPDKTELKKLIWIFRTLWPNGYVGKPKIEPGVLGEDDLFELVIFVLGKYQLDAIRPPWNEEIMAIENRKERPFYQHAPHEPAIEELLIELGGAICGYLRNLQSEATDGNPEERRLAIQRLVRLLNELVPSEKG